MPDTTFDVSVTRPAHSTRNPVVLIDAGHGNFHTGDGRYAPFAALLRNDGYEVRSSQEIIAPELLRGISVLVIANARGDTLASPSTLAFQEQECDIVRDWVARGGALLLVADHAPYGAAVENLARRFGVQLGKGFVYDSTASLENARLNLVFTRVSGTLGEHSILEGRDSTERIRRVVTFRGQSMTVPADGTLLLRLTEHAREAATESDVWARRGAAVRGPAQAVAIPFGRGRVVILGEAAVLTAQIARWEEDGKVHELRIGMNHPDTDDKQFALNVVRWLTRVLN